MQHELAIPIDPNTVHRELSEAIERTERLDQAIHANLGEAERELEEIKSATTSRPKTPV